MDEVKKVKNFVLPLYFCGKREVFTFTVSPRSFGKSNRHTYWLLYYYLLSPGDAMTIRETMTEPHPAPSPKGEGSEYNKAEALSVENLGGYLSSAMCAWCRNTYTAYSLS